MGSQARLTQPAVVMTSLEDHNETQHIVNSAQSHTPLPLLNSCTLFLFTNIFCEATVANAKMAVKVGSKDCRHLLIPQYFTETTSPSRRNVERPWQKT